MIDDRNTTLYEQALAAVNDQPDVSEADKIDMLVEIAVDLQMRPGGKEQLEQSIALYDKALEMCGESNGLLSARIHARKATALQMIPSEDASYLQQARAELESALKVLIVAGTPEEVAEAHLNLGLIAQSLNSCGKALITEAIELYQKSLRTFTKENYPTEFVILHNNLATAFLSIPSSDEKAKMREALAVQSFEAALQVVTLEDDPTEYAMLQNNLGNALQYVSSGHSVENNVRALEAYDEALKVRKRRTTPLPYANTIANKANCLRNLPDDPTQPEAESRANLMQSFELYQEAIEIFTEYGEHGKVMLLRDTLVEISKELGVIKAADGEAFGVSKV